MSVLQGINLAIAVLFFLCYSYQFFYIFVGLLPERPLQRETVPHDYAVLICARNEENVIGDLLQSLHRQTYDRQRMMIFVMADNCTDGTARRARELGATVYERSNRDQVGKGYALELLLANIHRDYPMGFDGYFVFDADNVLEPDYIEQMNRTFSEGYEIVTGYRNIKNYGDNWISAGYGLWFLRESRYLNGARHALGTSCAVSGTGFLFSRAVLQSTRGWHFHLLTEDIEFSAHHILQGRRIGFCRRAVLYDEQPVKFTQSWRQRLRWAKGYLQVFGRYGGQLARGIFRGSFACFDMTMSLLPAAVLSVAGLVTHGVMAGLQLAGGAGLAPVLLSALRMLGGMYGTLFLIGTVTLATEWRRIRATTAQKLGYLLTFPLFLFTYLPICLTALVWPVEWKPIEHHVQAEARLPELLKQDRS